MSIYRRQTLRSYRHLKQRLAAHRSTSTRTNLLLLLIVTILYTLCDDVMFSYNGPNRAESDTTRMFRPVRQVAAPEATSAASGLILFHSVSFVRSANIFLGPLGLRPQ